ncbi:DUF5615 family PIN-like protein [Pseudomonas sp. JH-2]|uniref:DUF5615 family PIN-like protein n=1 Tax=Pseudomonas sp. JH-2 TaxID=3114998 RepID=UPI002E271124|nr:DUF5615 family PIN-like protein [Pseudomonas sp. JH-2]
MSYSFLIDECLSPRLAQEAHKMGYAATSVRDRGWCGLKDREIIRHAMDNNFTLVTNNSVDFRGDSPPAAGGLYALEELHTGLVCLNAEEGVLDFKKQFAAFAVLLANLPDDLVNRALEVTVLKDGRCCVMEYAIPTE